MKKWSVILLIIATIPFFICTSNAQSMKERLRRARMGEEGLNIQSKSKHSVNHTLANTEKSTKKRDRTSPGEIFQKCLQHIDNHEWAESYQCYDKESQIIFINTLKQYTEENPEFSQFKQEFQGLTDVALYSKYMEIGSAASSAMSGIFEIGNISIVKETILNSKAIVIVQDKFGATDKFVMSQEGGRWKIHLPIDAIPDPVNVNISENDAMAKSILRTVSTALETYMLGNKGEYPENLNPLLQAIPPYLERAYCKENEISGFTFDCSFGNDGYEITATPVQTGISGSGIFSISTGGILE